MRKAILACLCAALLTACDGGSGGGGSTPTPTPTPVANLAPSFTSASSIYVPENSSGTIYTIAATDPEGTPLTYSLTGSEDPALFTLTGANLSFKTPPDFEAPTDSNHNNLYQVEITASDGVNNTRMLLNIFVTDGVPAGYSLKYMGRVFSGTKRMTNMVSGYAFQEDGGGVSCFDFGNATIDYRICASAGLGGGAIDTSDFSYQEERGLLGWAWAPRNPDWASSISWRYAVGVYTAANGDIVFAWTAINDWLVPSANAFNAPVPGRPPIWRIPNTATRNLGGWARFDSDGYLYVALGDGGDPSKVQDPNSPFGKIWRIDPYRDDYPADATRNFGAATILATGLRSPGTFNYDLDGNMIISDRGENRDEINVLPAGASNLNFGWPYRDGTLVRQAGAPAGLRAPAIEIERGTGPRQATGIVPGGVYRGNAVPLRDQYVFGDASGKIWMVPIARLLLGNLTGADLTLTDDYIRYSLHPMDGLKSIVGSNGSSLVLIDNVGFYYVLSDG